MAGGLAVLIPAEFNFQFSFHPVLGLGQDAKPVNGLEAAFVHDFVSPKELIDKYIAIIDANGLSEIANGGIVKGGFELNDVGLKPFIQGRSAIGAYYVIDLAGLLRQGEPVSRLFREGIEGPGTSFGGGGPGGGAAGGGVGDGCGGGDSDGGFGIHDCGRVGCVGGGHGCAG